VTFQPGQSGNPGGRVKAKPFREALEMGLGSAANGEECLAPPGSLRWNARKLLEQGDVQSIRELADRLDGKVPQAVVGDNDHDPLCVVTRIDRVIIPSPHTGRRKPLTGRALAIETAEAFAAGGGDSSAAGEGLRREGQRHGHHLRPVRWKAVVNSRP